MFGLSWKGWIFALVVGIPVGLAGWAGAGGNFVASLVRWVVIVVLVVWASSAAVSRARRSLSRAVPGGDG